MQVPQLHPLLVVLTLLLFSVVESEYEFCEDVKSESKCLSHEIYGWPHCDWNPSVLSAIVPSLASSMGSTQCHCSSVGTRLRVTMVVESGEVDASVWEDLYKRTMMVFGNEYIWRTDLEASLDLILVGASRSDPTGTQFIEIDDAQPEQILDLEKPEDWTVSQLCDGLRRVLQRRVDSDTNYPQTFELIILFAHELPAQPDCAPSVLSLVDEQSPISFDGSFLLLSEPSALRNFLVYYKQEWNVDRLSVIDGNTLVNGNLGDHLLNQTVDSVAREMNEVMCEGWFHHVWNGSLSLLSQTESLESGS